MDVVHAVEQLLAQALDLRHGKLDGAVEQPAEVVLHVLKDHVDAAFLPIEVGGCEKKENGG